MTKNCNFIDKLREARLRPTKQRVKICELLFNREKTFHFTINDLAKKISDELNEKLTDTSKKLSQLKFNNSVQTIENPLEIKILRRQLAKLKTVLNEKKQD